MAEQPTCPICHEAIASQDEAFPDDCFHCFCFKCITEWTRVQQKHPLSGRARGREVYLCPYCKTVYSSIIYDCQDQAFRRWRLDGSTKAGDSWEKGFLLTPKQRWRRSLYFGITPCPAQSRQVVRSSASWAARTSRSDVQRWLVRELQALLLDADDTLIAQHIQGVLKGAPEEEGLWLASVEAAVSPFLFERSACFAQQLRNFVASGQTLAAYDNSALEKAAQAPVGELESGDLEAANQPPAHSTTSEHRAGHSASTLSAESRSRSEDQVVSSDSEGYLPLLLRHAGPVQREEAESASAAGSLTEDTPQQTEASGSKSTGGSIPGGDDGTSTRADHVRDIGEHVDITKDASQRKRQREEEKERSP